MYTEGKIVVSAMYKFVNLEQFQELKEPLQLFMEQNDIWGEKNMIASIENKELVILDIGYLRLTGIGL